MKKVVFSILFLMLTLSISATNVAQADNSLVASQFNNSGDCVIPDSGPWPPCATGGNSGGGNGDCVIPDSGPWPPCATNGGNTGSGNTGGNSGGGNGDCVIPDSGPWPPCATSGGSAGSSSGSGNTGGNSGGGNGDCVIPDSGPWPPCATNGGNSGGNSGSGNTGGNNGGNSGGSSGSGNSGGGGEVIDEITIFYASNPNEVLGVFPVKKFDAQELYTNMVNMRQALWEMRDNLGGALDGDAASCARYTGAYERILAAGVFYDDVPREWGEIDLRYTLSFVYSLDRTRPAYLSCVNSGRVDGFNHGLAYNTVDQVVQVLGSAIEMADSLLD